MFLHCAQLVGLPHPLRKTAPVQQKNLPTADDPGLRALGPLLPLHTLPEQLGPQDPAGPNWGQNLRSLTWNQCFPKAGGDKFSFSALGGGGRERRRRQVLFASPHPINVKLIIYSENSDITLRQAEHLGQARIQLNSCRCFVTRSKTNYLSEILFVDSENVWNFQNYTESRISILYNFLNQVPRQVIFRFIRV